MNKRFYFLIAAFIIGIIVLLPLAVFSQTDRGDTAGSSVYSRVLDFLHMEKKTMRLIVSRRGILFYFSHRSRVVFVVFGGYGMGQTVVARC